VLICSKNIFFAKFEYGCQNNAEFNGDFETVDKNAKNLLTKKLLTKKCEKIGDCPLLYYVLTCKSFGQITISGCTFFQLFPQI
jgi:hypothetical protein